MLSFIKQTSGPSAYFTSFFPGIFVFGLGMSFTVAPLTATVMGSLPSHYSGTASGINNAITRIAGVLANAVLGALAILFFSVFLNERINNLHLNDNEKKLVTQEVKNLGNAKPPVQINDADKTIIANAYKEGFIDTYSKVMKICAVLAFISAFMSFLFIKNEDLKTDS